MVTSADCSSERTVIHYKSNDNWFGDIFHLGSSWTMRRITSATLLIGLYSTAVWFVAAYLELLGEIPLDISIFSVLGVIRAKNAFGLLLVDPIWAFFSCGRTRLRA